jgi:nicotinamidase-related amidase
MSQMNMDAAALIVIDMQNDFCHPDGAYGNDRYPSAQSVNSNCRKAVQYFHDHERPVIWVTSQYMSSTSDSVAQPASQHAEFQQRHKNGVPLKNAYLSGRYISGAKEFPVQCCKAGTWGAQLVDELQGLVLPSDVQIVKTWFSACTETPLLELVAERQFTSLWFCGVSTSTCVLATMLDVWDLYPGMKECVLVADATGASNESRYQEAVSWVSRFAFVQNMEDLSGVRSNC